MPVNATVIAENIEALEELVKMGADVNSLHINYDVVETGICAPIHAVASFGRHKSIAALSRLGANMNILMGTNGVTPLNLALNGDVIETLVRNGAHLSDEV